VKARDCFGDHEVVWFAAALAGASRRAVNTARQRNLEQLLSRCCGAIDISKVIRHMAQSNECAAALYFDNMS
jgi:hypothetical protein